MSQASADEAAQTVLVTGAAQGLGAIIAAQLHSAGWRVAVSDIDGAAAQAVADALDASGATACALTLDVAHHAAFETALALLQARWGRVQALVNNAAVTVATPVMDIAPDEFQRVLSVNAGSVFAGSQVFGRHFAANGYGRIVNLASLAGQNGGTATGAHYAASKGAIVTLTKVFARELGPCGVTVNAIAPGPLDLPIVYRTVPAERMEAFLRNIPVGALGDPAYVAATVAHLLSPAAGFVTGATWDLNGGLYLR
ncbi:SDR family NAD(P)-dependent oxidoreductase [Pseudoxanthomonas winnipegensis]|uniref:SDR family oxidoreductase n=1 Tax=Pseudoxanthomonas winnipegensis TaxID=2480810 RepID=A0A4Q8LJY9_9GAMM|nr:SDR family NAD(P)-dependent oxidoreductase [Pseudoxanthomonas winnipegensis]RZZ82623.1 SDR family oxidoreductase [Pseudoxanthomonas winnipegensis]TAA30582.1 SDR family oxidoreductase [Pseudoxanthomonas winnipegensis]